MNITTGINQPPEMPFPTLREHALSALVRSGQRIPDNQKASLMVEWNELKNHFENDTGNRSPLNAISSCEAKILYPDPASFDEFGILIDQSQRKPEAERKKEFMEKIGNLFLELSNYYPSKDFFGNVIPFNANACYLAIKSAPYPIGRILKESGGMYDKGMAKVAFPGPKEAQMRWEAVETRRLGDN